MTPRGAARRHPEVRADAALLVRALAHHASVVQDFSEVAVLFDEPRPRPAASPGCDADVLEILRGGGSETA